MTSLDRSDIEVVAEYIKSGKCKRIVLMLGAGVSTSAGIPDFRSPGTGLYANLARLKLPYPEAVFDIQFFLQNPVPFYTLANELYPGKFRPTVTHSFIRLLHNHSLLSMCFTQNIDTLERRAGVPEEKIIEAHGSFASQRCVRCRTPFDDKRIKDMVMNFATKKEVPRCAKKGCKGLVKPDIVFFGESLPPAFVRAPSITRSADLLIVMGTSLTVHPFASLAGYAPETCPRVLVNLDPVGDFGERESDVMLLGKCDEVVKELCRELGWEEELMKLWKETRNSVEGLAKTPEEGVDSATSSDLKEDGRQGDGSLEKEVAKLAEKIEKQMTMNEEEDKDKDATPASVSTSDSKLSGADTIQPTRNEDSAAGREQGESATADVPPPEDLKQQTPSSSLESNTPEAASEPEMQTNHSTQEAAGTEDNTSSKDDKP